VVKTSEIGYLGRDSAACGEIADPRFREIVASGMARPGFHSTGREEMNNFLNNFSGSSRKAPKRGSGK
jgi:hypothetical protein